MRKYFVRFAMVALMSFASCSKENDFAVVPGPGCEIFFTVGTRAVTTVVSLGSFNVNCVTGSAGIDEITVFNSEFSGDISYTGGKYWPSTDAGYKFYASNIAMTPAATGPTVAAGNSTDVVCAVCASPTYLSGNVLTFNHIFARLGKTVVTVQEGCMLSDFTLCITPCTSGVYNLYSGNGKTDGTGWSSTVSGSEVIIASSAGENAATDIYLVPGDYELEATYTLSMGDYVVTKPRVTGTIAITGGRINIINVTLGGVDATEISFSVSVTPWEEQSINVTIS